MNVDLNLVVIAGRLAADPEVTTYGSGVKLLRILVTTRSTEPRRRIDVLPVVMWDPPDDHPALDLKRGQRVWIAGSVQRRFWSADAGRTSRVEIVAHDIQEGKQADDIVDVQAMAIEQASEGFIDGAEQAQDDANKEIADMEAAE